MKKILIIGCGNIGTLYDINGSDINTHAKALKNNPNYSVSIFDSNKENIKKTLVHFNFKHIEEIHYNFDIVVIATSTNSHFYFLENCIKHQVPIVICEKPISIDTKELNDLKNSYSKGNTKVFINYIRQYIPEYVTLKKIIKDEFIKQNEIVNINISYTRGFLNNGGHAFNLLQFIMGKLNLTDPFFLTPPVYELANDPTFSVSCKANKNIPCTIKGLDKINYNFFEIELFLKSSYIKILNSGNEIIYKKIDANNHIEGYKQNLITINTFVNKSILKNYMSNVYQTIENSKADNFIDSLNLNLNLIKLISDVKTSN